MDNVKLKCLELAIDASGSGNAIASHAIDVIELAKKIEAYLTEGREEHRIRSAFSTKPHGNSATG